MKSFKSRMPVLIVATLMALTPMLVSAPPAEAHVVFALCGQNTAVVSDCNHYLFGSAGHERCADYDYAEISDGRGWGYSRGTAYFTGTFPGYDSCTTTAGHHTWDVPAYNLQMYDRLEGWTGSKWILCREVSAYNTVAGHDFALNHYWQMSDLCLGASAYHYYRTTFNIQVWTGSSYVYYSLWTPSHVLPS
jgi:hypothetical protein